MSNESGVGSIIIAAHDEASVIDRCLRALHPLVLDGVAEVIVVCNGCSDDTATRAAAYSGVIVRALSTASKTGALREGDRVATNGLRIYLDADVVLTATAASAVFSALRLGDQPVAARPPIRFDYSRAGVLVKSWYRVRESLPSISLALWGAGTYAMSRGGRARFGEFPEIVSDDLFIDSLFSPHEVVIVDTDPVVVTTPRRIGDLMKILVRTYRTQSDVDRKEGTAVSGGQRGQLADLRSLVLARPAGILDVATYIVVILAARTQAAVTSRVGGWGRDESSRR